MAAHSVALKLELGIRSKDQSVRQADWYFDFISPYAYLQFHRMDRLPADVVVNYRPVLFAGLLNHWGQLGPAEIPNKKTHTFLLSRWRAEKLGLPFKAPPRHPFNPLMVLRLAIAMNATRGAIGAIFDHIWADGLDAQAPDSMMALAEKLGVDDISSVTGAQVVKDQLRANTQEAVARGVYGVPTFASEDHLFWGDDMFDMMLEWLVDPAILDEPEARRMAMLPPAAERPRKPA